MIDLETKYLSIYFYTPKDEGSWFIGVSAFRHRWEFGLDRDWWDCQPSRYYLYAQQFNKAGLKINQYEFPRKNRWAHVIR